MSETQRLQDLEATVARLANRVHRLESRAGVAVLPPAPERLDRPTSPSRPEPRRVTKPAPAGEPPPRPRPAERLESPASLEDLLGGRVLAWVGGLAVLLGVVFLFAVAVSNGWIGEGVRTLLGAAASAGMLCLGIWLHEHKSRTDAALAAVAAGIAGLYVTLTVAAQVYELVPQPAALALALAVGALATALALSWDSRGIAGLGIVGALTAPLLVGAEMDGGTLALLFIAGASAVGVLLWKRWDWLALAVFAIVTPQWVLWLFEESSLGGGLLALCAFGALGIAAAIGYELRVPGAGLRPSSSFLLTLNALVLALAGYGFLESERAGLAPDLWLVGLAALHLGVGLGGSSSRRISHEIELLALVLGVVLADVAFGLLASGPILALGWAASGVGFAALLRRKGQRQGDAFLAQLGLGGHVTLAVLHALTTTARPDILVGDGVLGPAGAASLLAVAAGCLVSGRLAEEGHREWRVVLDSLGLAAVAYLTALALDGPILALAWSAEAVALAGVARSTKDEVAAWAAVVHLAGALGLALVVIAPPESLVSGLSDPLGAGVALGAPAVAALVAAAWRIGPAEWPGFLSAVAAVVCLYLASALIVTPFQPGHSELDTVLDLGVREQGQMLLSVFWAAVGLTALVIGLRGDLRPVRLGALALLLTTVAKVFLFDLATLTSVYRVISFMVLGLLLLVGAFVWQRLRPRALPDLREAPEGVR